MARPMKRITKQEGIKILDQSIELFKKSGFPKSSDKINDIKNELLGGKNFGLLNSFFKSLQTIFVVEYNTTSHRTQCSTFYKKRVNMVIKLNVDGLNKIRLDKRWANMIKHRTKARQVLFTLNKILHNGVRTDEERAISISYLYLANIDEVYGKNLKDILIFDMLANEVQFDYQQIEKMKLSDIKEYFSTKESDCLFDGWDDDIRNAIAHSSFWYDSRNKILVFEERRRSIRKTKSVDEVSEMLEKLSDLDELVFFYNRIFQIDKVIHDLK